VPTFERTEECVRNYRSLSKTQQAQFTRALQRFVDDMKAGRRFRAGLRVKRVVGMEGCWEMTWAPDGRAIFMYGAEIRQGEPHIVWLAIGTHSIFPS